MPVSEISFFVNVQQDGHDAARAWCDRLSVRQPFCALGARRYWLAGEEIRYQAPLSPRPGPWETVRFVDDSTDAFFVVTWAGEGHLLPKLNLPAEAVAALVDAQQAKSVLSSEGRSLANDVGQGDAHQDDAHQDDVSSGQPDVNEPHQGHRRSFAAVGNASLASGQAAVSERQGLMQRLVQNVKNFFSVLVRGVFEGARLSVSLKKPTAITSGPALIFSLAALLFMSRAVTDYFTVAHPRWFYLGSLYLDGAWVAGLVLVAYVVARYLPRQPVGLEPLLAHLAAAILIPLMVGKVFMQLGVPTLEAAGWEVTSYLSGLTGIWVAWIAVIVVRIFQALGHLGAFRASVLVVVSWSILFAMLTYVPTFPLWIHYEEETADAAAETGRAPVGAGVDVEATYYAQDALLESALARLAPQRPGVEDLYFVGFAGYSEQDVFMREVRLYREMLADVHNAKERSVLLINHPSALTDAPLANRHNLARTLARIGEIMDPDEDTLFLYLTSHGTRDGRFAVRFPPLGLNDLTPPVLAELVEASAVKWRIVVVSACFSGLFVDDLASPDALVMTAARGDRTSFGCENGRDFTYFGEALHRAIASTSSFPAAFVHARREVTAREKREGKDPSFPQIRVGAAISRRIIKRASETSQAAANVAAPPLGAITGGGRPGA